MKLCHNCGQALAEPIKSCPSCGHVVVEGLKYVDDYRILEVAHEGPASILCRAMKDSDDTPVALRLFKADSGVDENVAQRLKAELEELQKLPEDWFVRHHAIKCSSEGMWYRVSEWLEAESWGDLLSSGRLQPLEVAYDLFYRLAAILDGLHRSGHSIPHLILNDILILKGDPGRVDVKLDYKLSRFLDPAMAKPVALLQNLLECHPDIVKGRPLDFKSDVWSLGRIFTQILIADLELCDPVPAAKSAKLPKEIGILVRSMLTDDPDLRPRSMSEVADGLKRIKHERFTSKKSFKTETVGEIRKLKKTVLIIGLILGFMAAGGGIFLYKFNRESRDIETVFGEYADIYAGSVAFVVVEYQIRVEDEVIYSQRTEGTAFLVDPQGYLLTNRHVACPWLEDERMYGIIGYLRNADKTPLFDYQIYLWFEGATAFNRLFGIGEGDELEDVYDLLSAYSSNRDPRVEIAGVAKAPARRGQMIKAPLRDDFAVLKIHTVPKGLRPLPLDRDLDAAGLKRLLPVMALGFPLGRSSQVDVINVSITRGHVRRTFENFFQVDTSIYKGNSGGPIIDGRGQVIGIASAVATDVAVAPMPVITHLSDIGLVLPVTKAAVFIDELKAGRSKWNGVLDLSAAARINEMTDAAYAGRWTDAVEMAEKGVKESDDPSLLMTAAMIHYCTGSYAKGRVLFDRVLSIDRNNHQARLMRYLIDRHHGRKNQSVHLGHLLALDWRSTGELFGHLTRILHTVEAGGDLALDRWNNLAEKAWVYYIGGLSQLENGNREKARSMFKVAAHASKRDEWPIYLALSALDQLNKDLENGSDLMSELLRELENKAEKNKDMRQRASRLMSQFQEAASDPAAKSDILLKMHAIEPENRKFLAYSVFYGAMASQWQQSLDTAEKYLQLTGREEPLRLGVRLLVPGILYHMGDEEGYLEQLKNFRSLSNLQWYQQIYDTLLERQSEVELIRKAGNVPEKILTAYSTLGFHAEARGDHGLAGKYYREALGSYLDNWAEYELVRQRYINLKRDEKK